MISWLIICISMLWSIRILGNSIASRSYDDSYNKNHSRKMDLFSCMEITASITKNCCINVLSHRKRTVFICSTSISSSYSFVMHGYSVISVIFLFCRVSSDSNDGTSRRRNSSGEKINCRSSLARKNLCQRFFQKNMRY
jgi:hypothetical protein